ncbi:hypothetical protein Q1695_001147 [Nippostrongylus brasiliensis]|nr:hypothetical protein Q1695_001147 [Nippostrongylus brasiliensis]
MEKNKFIKVIARIRPSASMIRQERIVDVTDSKNLCFYPRNPKHFTYDAVFDENVTQDQVFDELGSEIIDGCVKGINGTIIAYGQTGSGKTYTMLGPTIFESFVTSFSHRGVIPRACEALFARLRTRADEMGEYFKYEVSCKFVELYNEEFYDLLSSSQEKLAIRSGSKVVQLLGVSEHPVLSSVDMMRILIRGGKARRTAETAMNRRSSRSHAILIIDVKTEEADDTVVTKRSATLKLVDLAGSGRQTQAKAEGNQFKELNNINSSLTVLRRVALILSGANRGVKYVPYGESKLTHLLRDSLGGNSRTTVIVNIHPDIGCYSDTLSTLQFSADCRKILNCVHANEELTTDADIAYRNEKNRWLELARNMETERAVLEQKLQICLKAAISREKKLVQARIHRDALSIHISRTLNGEGPLMWNYDTLDDMISERFARIDAVRTLEDLLEVLRHNDIFDVGCRHEIVALAESGQSSRQNSEVSPQDSERIGAVS